VTSNYVGQWENLYYVREIGKQTIGENKTNLNAYSNN
jgi:hypothetical protein